MKWRWPIIILLFAAVIYLTAHLRDGPTIKLGEKRDWSLLTLDGQTLGPANPSGGVTVVEFWATWCGPCVQMTPHLKQLHDQYKDRGLRLISVSVDEDLHAQQQFIADNAMNWTHANDGQQPASLADAWGIRAIPHAFILSPTGELLWDGHPGTMDGPLAEAVAKYPKSAK